MDHTQHVTRQEIPPIYQSMTIGQLRAYQFSALTETSHAVFTRLGGVSRAPWQSLNLSRSVGDAAVDVATNFTLACQALRIHPQQTAASHLVHGNRVVVARNGSGTRQLDRADGLITQGPGLFLTMRFADCTPLLFYDRGTRSVGLAHAGWRGTMKNVMGAVVEAMQTHFGSRPEDIVVVIGPSIGPCCYEVGEDVFAAAQEQFTDPAPFFLKPGLKRHLDMWAANAYQAEQAGVRQITVSGLCTACRTDEFFSHRAEKGKTGRFGVFLGLPKDSEA